MTVQPHDEENIETLSSGVAALVDETADQDEDGEESYRARIVPLGEDDITRGGSGKKTYWDAETLREGVESGAFDGAKLLKGRAGAGHKSMLDQADPDEIVGKVPSFDYEDGVGPVGDGDLLDEHLAKLVDHELLEVSPDMWRVLGEYDEELGAYRVDEIIDVPYITLLDRGASEGASISPAEGDAEALGAVSWGDRVNELAETLAMPAETVQDRLDHLADLEQDVAWEGLGQPSEDVSPSDEPAEPGAGSADTDTTPQMDPEELQEQLADVRSERDELESEKDDLAEQLSEKEATIEKYEDRIDDLEEEVTPLAEMLAELVAEDSVLSAESVADRFEPSEMVEMLAESGGWDEDDDRPKLDVVKEQLSGAPDPRGEGGDPEGGAGGLTDDDLANAEQLADEVMTASDRLSAGDSGREYLKQTYDVDPAEFDDAGELRAAIRSNGGD